ncbi:hypothetical protein RB195_013594 [Necator americanus]|uniref:L-Fucosyltransferase n=1 Tax=Necator americanus TaxID=51031 RepID=A0ABR1DW97_NECAM
MELLLDRSSGFFAVLRGKVPDYRGNLATCDHHGNDTSTGSRKFVGFHLNWGRFGNQDHHYGNEGAPCSLQSPLFTLQKGSDGTREWSPVDTGTDSKKFVGFHLNWGRFGNQLFHLITGYGIARTLKRTHYLPFKKGVRDHVIKYLQQFSLIFPRLEQTYVLAEDGINQTQVSFAGSCCAYDNPLRLSNNTDTYLLLNFIYGQNPRYFEDYLPDIREILQFSVEMRRNGSEVVNVLKRTHSHLMCIHIRRTDFIERKISTDLSETVNAANNIAKQMNISQFMIFGDDQQFMRNMSFAIVRDGKWADNAVLISKYEESMDLYIASQMCKSFLITAVTSTFGWWLAFFIPNQSAVFYMPDRRPHADKVPSKELFLNG